MAYKVDAVVSRIRDMDFEASAWKRYTALCTLALARGTNRKTLTGKVFGQDKPSPSFRQAFNIADKLFAAGMGDTAKRHMLELNIDEALTFALSCLASHMTALGVSGKNAYLEVAHHADGESLKAARETAEADRKADEAEAAAVEAAKAALAAEAEAEGDTAVSSTTEAIDEPIVGVDLIFRQVEGLDDAELLELATRLQTLMIQRNETATLLANAA